MTRFDQSQAVANGADAALTRLIRRGVQFEELLDALLYYADFLIEKGADSAPRIALGSHNQWFVIQTNGLDQKQCKSLHEAVFEFLDRLIAAATAGKEGPDKAERLREIREMLSGTLGPLAIEGQVPTLNGLPVYLDKSITSLDEATKFILVATSDDDDVV